MSSGPVTGMAEAIDETELARLVERFYERVRADAALGPIFEDAVGDWPAHLETLTDFWSSVMLTSGRYKGNPVAAHRRHAGQIEPALFDRWLALWGETTDEVTPREAAMLKAKAARIAESLKLALFYRPGPPRPGFRPIAQPPDG